MNYEFSGFAHCSCLWLHYCGLPVEFWEKAILMLLLLLLPVPLV